MRRGPDCAVSGGNVPHLPVSEKTAAGTPKQQKAQGAAGFSPRDLLLRISFSKHLLAGSWILDGPLSFWESYEP